VTSVSTLWRRLLIYTHRWLGIAGSVLFVVWFVSGVVLMYAGMPTLSSQERLRRAPVLDLSTARLGVSEAAVKAGFTPSRIVVGMHGDRPVYRLAGAGGWTTVYADSGEVADVLTDFAAIRVVERFAPEAPDVRYDARLTTPDQWTLQSRAFFPLHRIRLGDDADTVVYVSDRMVQPVLQTDRASRRWAYLGAVLHWLYFTPLRARAAFWSDLVIGLSLLGCVLCLSGVIWGLWRLSVTTVYRFREGVSHSPYAGLMRWHHYTGLVFGLFTFTWVFSGVLSMEPWGWHPGTDPTRSQRMAVSGGALRLGPLGPDALGTAVALISESFVPKELEVVQLANEPHVLAFDPSGARREVTPLPTTLATLASQPAGQRLVSMVDPERGAFVRFDDARFEQMARVVMPGATVVDATWLRAYDAYYYDRSRQRRLPVLRAKYDDAVNTWLYFDPFRGAIARKEERLTRINRWLYHGLHSFDFPFLYTRRPWWDLVVIGLSLGGIIVSVTSATQGWRRLRRHAARIAGARARFGDS